jgi:hypothetical protein
MGLFTTLSESLILCSAALNIFLLSGISAGGAFAVAPLHALQYTL